MKKITAPLFVIIVIIALFPSCKKIFENRTPKVDAGSDITVLLPEDSVLLTGSASDKDGQIESYQWLKISGPAAAIQQPDSASTWVKNLKEGSYLFKLIATDNNGYFGSDTVRVNVEIGDADTLSFQPTHNEWEVHLFGNETGIDQTHKDAPEIAGASGTFNGDPVNIRALLRFNLNQLPAGAQILKAKLTLYSNPDPLNGVDEYPNFGTNNALLLQRVTEAWDFATVTWLGQPSATSNNQVEIPHTDERSLDLIDIDVKDLITDMVNEDNYGFLLRLKTEEMYNFRIFASSKFPDAGKHPKLEVIYK